MLPFRPDAQPESMLSIETENGVYDASLLRAENGNQALRALPVLQEELERAQTENKKLSTDLKHANAIANEYTEAWVKEKKAVIRRIEADQQRIKEDQQTIAELQKNLHALRKRITDLENEAAIRSQTLAQLCQQRNAYQQVLAEKSMALANKSIALAEKTTEAAHLSKLNEDLQARNATLSGENAKLSGTTSQLLASLQSAKTASAEKEEVLQQKSREIQKYQTDIRTLETEHARAIRDLNVKHQQKMDEHIRQLQRRENYVPFGPKNLNPLKQTPVPSPDNLLSPTSPPGLTLCPPSLALRNGR